VTPINSPGTEVRDTASTRPRQACAPPAVWFLTSEMEGDRAGSFRQERWCEVFLRKGTAVTIFNLEGATHLAEFRFTHLEQLHELRRNVLARGRRIASIREGAFVRLLRKFKHLTMVDLYLPNVIRLVLRLAKRLMSLKGRVLLMASSPPFATATAGAMLKRIFPRKVLLAVDMRDAWALHSGLGGIKPLKKALEGMSLRQADRTTTVSVGLKTEFEEAHGVRTRVLYNVATHYASEGSVRGGAEAVGASDERKPVTIVYTGSTPVGFYDIRSLVEGIRLFQKGQADGGRGIHVEFVGACDEVRREVERVSDLAELISFRDHMPQREVREIQRGADVLLFLGFSGEGNKGVVSTKLFEYIALGKPILPISVRPDSDVDILLRRLCGRSVQAGSPASIAESLRRVAVEGIGYLPQLTDPSGLARLFDEYFTFADEMIGVAGQEARS
jgi:glycosyltransferase involved in cell wall biosynthesis